MVLGVFVFKTPCSMCNTCRIVDRELKNFFSFRIIVQPTIQYFQLYQSPSQQNSQENIQPNDNLERYFVSCYKAEFSGM